MALNGRFPAKYRHEDTFGAAHVVFYLHLQILEGVQVIVETLLIAAMAAFHFAIVLRRFGPKPFAQDMIFS